MQDDAETILSLIRSERNPIFALGIIPFYALFVQSCKEYLGNECLDETISIRIKDIRNFIKAYDEGFGKSRRRIASVDNTQDTIFKSRVKSDILKEKNLYYNIGTFWTDDRFIISNTQLLANYIDMENPFSKECEEKLFQLSMDISSFVSSVADGLAEIREPPVIERNQKSVSINYYCDLNTRIESGILGNSEKKDLNLFFLHLLCNMNFVKHILRPLLPEENIWFFKVEYNVTYYTYRALLRLRNYCDNNTDVNTDMMQINNVLHYSQNLFQSKFRNCMMHYDLSKRDVISYEYLDRPFYGIIETCFGGIDYYTYKKELHAFSDEIIACLTSMFNFENLKLKKL